MEINLWDELPLQCTHSLFIRCRKFLNSQVDKNADDVQHAHLHNMDKTSSKFVNEPRHEKTNNVAMNNEEIQISLSISSV